MVIFLFLRNVSATIIPSLALPMSIVGTFSVMYLLGYTVDNLSLMALVLAVGFVVDDAIVMLENIVRHLEMGEERLEAALQRIAGNQLHHSLHDPFAGRGLHSRAFHGRILGRLLHEFAVTIMSAILVSGVVSLTLDAHAVQPLPAPAEDEARLSVPLSSAVFEGAGAPVRLELADRAAAPVRHLAVVVRHDLASPAGCSSTFPRVPSQRRQWFHLRRHHGAAGHFL